MFPAFAHVRLKVRPSGTSIPNPGKRIETLRPTHPSDPEVIMTSFAPPEIETRSVDNKLLPVKIAATLALAALADWLFYDQRLGLSVVIFAVAYACASLFVNLGNLDQHQLQTGSLGQRGQPGYRLSGPARATGPPGNRSRARAPRFRSHPCLPPQLPCKRAARADGLLAELGLPQLAAPAHAGSPAGFSRELDGFVSGVNL